MTLKHTILTGLSAAALTVAAMGVAADDAMQSITIGVGSGLDGFGDDNAVAVAALRQNAVQIGESVSAVAIPSHTDAGIDFGEHSFQNQILSNNNFNSGVNAVQGNALAVSSATSGGPGAPALAGLGF